MAVKLQSCVPRRLCCRDHAVRRFVVGYGSHAATRIHINKD